MKHFHDAPGVAINRRVSIRQPDDKAAPVMGQTGEDIVQRVQVPAIALLPQHPLRHQGVQLLPAPAAGEVQPDLWIKPVQQRQAALVHILPGSLEIPGVPGVSHRVLPPREAQQQMQLTLRVPAEKLDAFLEGAGGAGRVTRREESAYDVTESYYDTKARLETQQALMARLQALVTDAADLSDLLALESQIADTQYQIDALQSRLNSTDRQVDYATVNVSLREEIPSDSITDVEMTLGQRIGHALTTGWDIFTSFLGDTAVFLVAALPFLALVAVAWIVVRMIRRSRRRKG